MTEVYTGDFVRLRFHRHDDQYHYGIVTCNLNTLIELDFYHSEKNLWYQSMTVPKHLVEKIDIDEMQFKLLTSS